jgi:hypothetical protein
LGVVLVATAGAACASSGLTQFPSAAELGEIGARPAGERIAPDDVVDVERWKLTGPLPDAFVTAAHAPATAWDAVLKSAVGGREGLVLASESTFCVARETGLFYLDTHGRPSEALQRFIEGRCGLAGSGATTGFRWADVPVSVADDRILNEWRADVEGDLAKAVGDAAGPEVVGIWYGRKNGRAVVTWASARRAVQVDRIPMVPEGGHVVIRGELLMPAEHLQGLANAGRFGVHHCVADPQLRLPRFALTCDVDGQDPSSRLEVAAFPPGRVLGPVVLSLLVWPAGAPGDTFTRPGTEGAACAAPAGGDVAGALAACVNQARLEARLPPLQASPAQSQTAARLAPHFFAALLGAEPELVADKVVLGVRAGWDVGAPLRYGQFASGLVQGGSEVARLVASVLERPSGREALLDPDANRLAVGPIAGGAGQKVLGALFGTYALFEGRDDPRDVERVLQRLSDLRARQGRPAAHRLSSAEGDIAAAARRIAAEGRAPTDALNDALQTTAERTHAAVKGWWVDAAKLDEMDLPPELLQAPTLNVAVAVSHYRREGEPWTRYVVVLVVVTPQQTLALRH